MSKKLLGIDLGGTTVKFGILNADGEVQEKWAIGTNTFENGSHIVPDIVESLKHRLELYGLTAEDFIGIGMGSPGAVDRENKTVTGAFNLNWAETQEVGSVIEKNLVFHSLLIMMLMWLHWVNVGLVLVLTIGMLSL